MQATKTEPQARSSGSVERIYRVVKARAIAFSIKPGERLNEVALARELNVSRTPLREALNRLVSEEFLRWLPRRGYVVRELDSKEIFDLYEFRAALEVSAARMACERATDEEIEDLLRFVESRSKNADERDTLHVLGLDEEFHERLVALSGNQEMVRVLRNVNARIRFVRWIDMEKGRRAITQGEHAAVLDALKTRDADAVTRCLHDHITHRLDQITEVIGEGYLRIYSGNGMTKRRSKSR
jgi:DNA-binding GntR family transcriptional regulator